MTKRIHKGSRNAVKVVAHKAKAGRSSCVMKPEYLALIENFRNRKARTRPVVP